MRRPPAALAAALLVPPAACARQPTAPSGPVRVTASAAAYARDASGRARVPFTVANGGAEPVGVVQCGPTFAPVVERRKGGRWVTYAGGLCQAIYPLGPVALAPGASRADTTAVGAAGRYRIVVALESGRAASPGFDVE